MVTTQEFENLRLIVKDLIEAQKVLLEASKIQQEEIQLLRQAFLLQTTEVQDRVTLPKDSIRR